MNNFLKEVEKKLWEAKEEAYKSFKKEPILVLSPIGIEKMKKANAELSYYVEFPKGNSRFMDCEIYEGKDLKQDFLIIKKI